MHPVFLGDRTVDAVIPGAKAGELNPGKVLRIWQDQHRNIYVGVDPDCGWTDDDVAAVWRAIYRIEQQFSELFSVVSVTSTDRGRRFLSHPSDDPWTNQNKVSAFVVVAEGFQHQDKPAMATNYYSLGAANGRIFENVPFIGLNPRAIDGLLPHVGPQLIYTDQSREEARATYLDEGIADSILHERLHAFIAQFYGHDRLFGALRVQGSPKCEYDLEELLVKQFLLNHYVETEATFSETFWSYWRRDTEVLATRVKASDCYRRLEQAGLLDAPLIRMPHPAERW